MSELIAENKEMLKKGLLYRSVHRGCKETDILVGKFAEAKLDVMSDAALALFGEFIVEDDAEIYDWILNKSDTPAKYLKLVDDVRVFHDLAVLS
jgi:antitoxin CptB